MKRLLFLLPLSLALERAPAAACFDPFADATADGGTSYAVGSFLLKQVNGLGTIWYSLTNTPAPPATGIPVVASGNLSYPGLPAPTGNSISIPASTGVMGRLTLDFTVTSGTAYYSFLLKVTDLSGVDTSGTQNNFFAGFGDTIGNQNATLLRAATRLYARRAGAGFNLGVSRNSSTPANWVFDTTQRNTNDILFVVGCYDYNNHTAKLWINPSGSTFGANTAPTPTITATAGADLNSNGIRAFVLGCRTNPPPGCLVDELRVGTTWAYVTGAPDIAEQPADQALDAGATATFAVKAAGGPPLSYQWRKDGVSLTNSSRVFGANTAMLSISNLAQSDAGGYSVKITNSYGSITNLAALLTVNDPVIITQPLTQVLPVGTNAAFQVVATGVPPLTYQWYKDGGTLTNGGQLSGATTSTLIISNISYGDAGSYWVQVVNGSGHSVLSDHAGLVTTDPSVAARRPNIIFILCDDLGYGDLGVLYQNSRAPGLPREATPHLDTLAAEGIRFGQHYCPAPVCAPSRASLLLGVHQGHANVRDEQWNKALANNHTLASVLRKAGYATAAIGKWGLGGDDVGGTTPADWAAYPTQRGFDYFFGYERHGDGHEHYPKEAVYSSKSKECYDGTNNITPDLDKCYTTDLFTARAKKWIADHRAARPAQPFFLYLAYDTPHSVYELPTQAYPAGGGANGGLQWVGTPGHMINTASGTVDSWVDADYAAATYDDDSNPATPEVAWPEVFQRYAMSVRRIDDAVGDLRQLLQDLAMDTNTLVVFTSDNGPTTEDALSLTPRYAANFFDTFGPLDGNKRDLWEGGIRMPTLVRWPGTVAPGAISNTPSQFQDWMPTFTELAGLPVPARSDGVSLVPTLTGVGTQQPSTIYVEYEDIYSTPNYPEFEPAHRGRVHNQMQVIRLNGFQGVRYDITAHTNDFEIYDVAHDLKQVTNLAVNPSFAGLQQAMKDRVLQVRRPDSSAPRPYDDELVPAVSVSPTTYGVEWKAYAQAFPWVPELTMLANSSGGTTNQPTLAVRPRDDAIGLLFNGYVVAPADGDYSFYLAADTGALLRIHDATVIDADFGYVGDTEVSGTIKLKAGLHPFRLYYARGTAGSPTLSFSWSGPGFAKQLVPESAFRRDGLALADYWFPFNQTSGLTTEEAGGGATASLVGFASDPAQWVAGKFNRAVQFDGVANAVVVNGFEGIVGTNPRTISAWVKTTETANSIGILSWGDLPSGNKWSLLVQNTTDPKGTLRLELGYGNTIASTPVNDGQWHHVACTLDSLPAPTSTDVKFYVDGQPDSVIGGAPVAINTVALDDVLIGSDIQNRFFSGVIDEVRIYNRALSAGEIASLFNATNQSAAAWHHRYFGNAAIDWSADDDGDGAGRLGEYAFGGQPQIADPETRQMPAEIVSDHLQFRFNRRVPGTHDLIYGYQSSSDLKSWTALAGAELSVSPSALLPGFEEVRFRAAAEVSSAAPLFIRLSARLP